MKVLAGAIKFKLNKKLVVPDSSTCDHKHLPLLNTPQLFVALFHLTLEIALNVPFSVMRLIIHGTDLFALYVICEGKFKVLLLLVIVVPCKLLELVLNGMDGVPRLNFVNGSAVWMEIPLLFTVIVVLSILLVHPTANPITHAPTHAHKTPAILHLKIFFIKKYGIAPIFIF